MSNLPNNIQDWINKQAACWRGYEQVGMKMLNGREVPNCVPASKSIPNSKPKKKKTEKKAYGYGDDYVLKERYLDGGDISGMSKEEAILYTKLLQREAKNRNLQLYFESERDSSSPKLTPEQAIEALNKAKNLDNYSEENLPYYRTYESTPSFFGLLSGDPIDYDDLPEDAAWEKYHATKTKKKAEEGFNVSDYIADVPIKCTPGVGCKRLLSEAEQAEIEDAESSMFPNLFPQDADPVSSLISSPGWAGIGSGLLGAAGLGGVVGLGAHLTNKDPLVYGGLAAALGGLGVGLYGYLKKNRKNKEIAHLIEDLPVGADIGDIEMYSDPKIRAAISRDFQRQLMRKNLV